MYADSTINGGGNDDDDELLDAEVESTRPLIDYAFEPPESLFPSGHAPSTAVIS